MPQQPDVIIDQTHARDARSRREALSEEARARIRIKNRRKLYLDRHPSYFNSPDLELADPLLYDRCVRRFQSAAEREAEGRSKGYSGVLEADLYRSEAKLAALAGHPPGEESRSGTETVSKHVTYIRGPDGQILPEDPDEIPKTKREGMERWISEMTVRFLNGQDEDFSYKDVDESDAWDAIENREAEEQWFEEEEPQWADDASTAAAGHGETGVQDF